MPISGALPCWSSGPRPLQMVPNAGLPLFPKQPQPHCALGEGRSRVGGFVQGPFRQGQAQTADHMLAQLTPGLPDSLSCYSPH